MAFGFVLDFPAFLLQLEPLIQPHFVPASIEAISRPRTLCSIALCHYPLLQFLVNMLACTTVSSSIRACPTITWSIMRSSVPIPNSRTGFLIHRSEPPDCPQRFFHRVGTRVIRGFQHVGTYERVPVIRQKFPGTEKFNRLYSFSVRDYNSVLSRQRTKLGEIVNRLRIVNGQPLLVCICILLHPPRLQCSDITSRRSSTPSTSLQTAP